MMIAGLVLLLGAAPGWTQPAINDSGDAMRNVAGGDEALQRITTGFDNTAFGFLALSHTTTGDSNTAFGKSALRFNTIGRENTAVGLAALGLNAGNGNTAVGGQALGKNTTGNGNTAVGSEALPSNTTGSQNTAVGPNALNGNTTGSDNTAVGHSTLADNTTGISDTAVGRAALLLNTTGSDNTAVGYIALQSNTTGSNNTAVGRAALDSLTAGSNNNIALGSIAGGALTSGSNNIYLGSDDGAAVESDTIRLGAFQDPQTRTFIAGIAGTPLAGSQVVVTSSGQLGILASSARYKRNIQAMGARSRGLFELRPVTFRYRQDPQGVRQYGLIAEEVGRVYPELVTRGRDGTVQSVQYQELIPMLLNELQRQQRELGELRAQSAALNSRLVQLEKTFHAGTLASRATPSHSLVSR
jgi:hypothetical protein